MRKIINIILIMAYIILLMFSIFLLLDGYICDNQTCSIFTAAFKKPETKYQILYILDKLCEDGIWPFAYISASILSALFFGVLPIELTIRYFTITFLLSFITFYCIMAFIIHHYVIPVKNHIKDYIKNIDSNDNKIC